VARSELIIDLAALRANVRRLVRLLGEAELWAVVKADAYGHGAETVARVALEEGARGLCVATVGEGAALRESVPTARILVMSPSGDFDVEAVRASRLELAVAEPPFPEGVALHLKLDTGMGRFGMSGLPAELPPGTVGLMSHLATADSDPSFAARQLARFRAAIEQHPHLVAHIANSAAALRMPPARLSACRVGLALHGLSPFGTDPAADALAPVLTWRTRLEQVKLLGPGESTGYGRRFVAGKSTWIGLVPVGYADGFARALTGTKVLVEGDRCRVIGTISMDSFAVQLPRELPRGTSVTLIGDGLLAEEHARAAGTITYEIVTGIRVRGDRVVRRIVGA
jgi:alanine racemase